MWTDPAKDPDRRLEVDLPVPVEGKAGADPVAVRLAPDAPVPFPHDVPAPLLDAVPRQISAALGEPADGGGVVQWRPKPAQRDHRRRAGVEHALHIAREARPIRDRIRRVPIEYGYPDNLLRVRAKPPPDLFPIFT